ncbi:phage tail assembly protein [Pseudomonas aeruginosa]|nr:phage tail assembly protein [Pseudomonas aeruginosa]
MATPESTELAKAPGEAQTTTAAVTTAPEAAPPAEPRKLADNEVELDEPIKRGESSVIQFVTVRKPSSGELRGTNLQDLLALDVGALIKVLPRITTPIIHEQEVARLDPADLLQLGSKVSGFLLSKRVKKELSLDV